MKEKKLVNVIPYNTLFFEACSEGKIIDFFLRLRDLDENDRNYLFIKDSFVCQYSKITSFNFYNY